MEAREVLLKYVKETGGSKFFLGDDSVQEDMDATVVLATACPLYKDDEEEEIYLEGTLTCYNCRYRRWSRTGFSCFKDFPVS